jgi:predicted permease
MVSDFRFALRLLRQSPGWTAVVVLSLALGIGISTTVFSLVDAVFLRPLPVRDPATLVRIDGYADGGRLTLPAWLDTQEFTAAKSFEGVAAYSRVSSTLRDGEEKVSLLTTVVSPNFFGVLGLKPLIGRLPDAQSAEPEFLISYSLWQRRFGGDPAITSRPVRLNDRSMRIAGVMPREVAGMVRLYLCDVWITAPVWKEIGYAAAFERRGSDQWEALARLKPDATFAQASAEIAAISAQMSAAHPATNGRIRYQGRLLSDMQWEQARGPALILIALVGLVLWIACSNVAGLLIAQSEARRREIAVRQAIGASRARLVRMMLTETALLSAIGGAVGVLLAYWLLDLAPLLLPPSTFQVEMGAWLDSRVLLFSFAITVLAVVMAGVVPAIRASSQDLASEMRVDTAGAGSARGWLRSAIVVAQVALAVVLLNSAALLARSYFATLGSWHGFDANRKALIVGVRPKSSADLPRTLEICRTAAETVPGVVRATYMRRLPMWGSGGGATIEVERGRSDLPIEQRVAGVRFNQVGPNYFEVMGTRVLRGRQFQSTETSPVALVSEAFVQRFYPDRDAVGEWLSIGGKETQIVGVVENAPMNGLHEPPQAFVYLPFAQRPSGDHLLLVESQNPQSVAKAVHAALAGTGVVEESRSIQTFADHVKSAFHADWAQAALGGVVAMAGLLLAAVGLFAAVSYAARRRTREFGVRLALGATSRDLFLLVCRQSLWLAGVGAGVGLAAGLGVAWLIRGILSDVSPADPVALTTSVVTATLISIAASIGPAVRAWRIDPHVTLRSE